jgi:hypothetical protein
MIFKPMDQDLIRELLKDVPNVIKVEVEKHEEYFSKLECFYCGGSCRPVLLPSENVFREGSILPDYVAECNDCAAQFTPYTKIEVKGPTKDPLADD